MTAFIPKIYQQSVLDSVVTYFQTIHQLGDADTAFYKTTQNLWNKGLSYGVRTYNLLGCVDLKLGVSNVRPDPVVFCMSLSPIISCQNDRVEVNLEQ